jgi:hypothetical protein
VIRHLLTLLRLVSRRLYRATLLKASKFCLRFGQTAE